MSKLAIGTMVSGVFAVAITVTPVPEAVRPYVVVASWSVLAVLVVIWLYLHFTAKNPIRVSNGFSANAKSTDDVVTAKEGSTASKISTGVGNINAPIAGRDINYYVQAESKETLPHVYPRLCIDSLDQEPGWIALHFEIINGNTMVENVRLSLDKFRGVTPGV